MPISEVYARYLTHRTHLDKEGEIVVETWRNRLLFKVNTNYTRFPKCIVILTQKYTYYITNWHCY